MGTATAVAVPLRGYMDLKVLNLYASIGPTYYLTGNREKADWDVLGKPFFGHEFAWSTGARVGLGPLGVGFSYGRRYTAYGEDSMIGLGLSL